MKLITNKNRLITINSKERDALTEVAYMLGKIAHDATCEEICDWLEIIFGYCQKK